MESNNRYTILVTDLRTDCFITCKGAANQAVAESIYKKYATGKNAPDQRVMLLYDHQILMDSKT